jgi:uncharacterized membrane-anchored protein YjiN (DUF445 family)
MLRGEAGLVKLHTGRVYLTIALCVLLTLNPVLAAVASATQVAGSSVNTSELEDDSIKGIIERTLFMFGCMLRDESDLSDQTGKPEKDRVKEGLLDPLMETAGTYFAGVLEDERIQDVIGRILDDITSDERIAGFDLNGIIIKILRDEKLAEILGDAIADYLKDEKFLEFVTWITNEILRLLKDDQFAYFIKHAIKDFLGDGRVVDVLQTLLEILIEMPEEILERLRNDERIEKLLVDLVNLVQESVSGIVGGMLEDERLAGAFESFAKKIEHLPEEFKETLSKDEKFKNAVKEFTKVFSAPFDGLLSDIDVEEVIAGAVYLLVKELEGEESLQLIKDKLNNDLNELLEKIGPAVDNVMDYYSDRPRGGGGGGGGGDGDGGEPDIIERIMSEKEIEDQISDFLPYWAELAAEFFGERAEELGAVFGKYFEEDSPYINRIITAVDAALQRSLNNFKDEITLVVKDHTGTYPIEEVLIKYQNDPRLKAILEDARKNSSFGDLIELVKSKQPLFEEIFDDIISTLPIDMIINGARNGDEFSGVLDELIVEIPYDAIANLLSDEDIDKIIEGLFGIVNELPLTGLAPFLRQNADYIGHTIATTLLNGIADGLDKPPEPPEPPTRAVKQSWRTCAAKRGCVSFILIWEPIPKNLHPNQILFPYLSALLRKPLRKKTVWILSVKMSISVLSPLPARWKNTAATSD